MHRSKPVATPARNVTKLQPLEVCAILPWGSSAVSWCAALLMCHLGAINTPDHNIPPFGLSILSGCLNPLAASTLKDPILPRACLKGSGPAQPQCSHRQLQACWGGTDVLQPVLQARVKQKLQKLFSSALPSISCSSFSACSMPRLSVLTIVEPQLQKLFFYVQMEQLLHGCLLLW